ncbi:hypothetical protein F4778DRAFT_455878 [Xylariomycetidae sp. FL2044]|nr:hypothetical protein F4778DRAFT_455878 [Xylariomycetidae sp. FL2044]
MLQSRLSRCSLLIALGTIGVWANNVVDGLGPGGSLEAAGEVGEQISIWKRVEHVVVERELEVEKFLFERIPDTLSSPRERPAPALGMPQPTAAPQKRQDDGQIQALSSQLQSLSQSATQAISSVSSSASSQISQVSQSAQSVRQSADGAVRSANQNADDANRQLSQTQSSASSAVSQARAQASDQISRSLSSMSSRISVNLASAEASAASQVSSVSAEASSSAANAVNIAMSQIQAARADASGVRGDANSIVDQVRSNSVSGTNVAIIVTVAVVGTAIISVIASCLVIRCRRNKKRAKEGEAAIITFDEKPPPEKPVAVRGSPASPRFTPFGGGTGYPMDKFKLPKLSPLMRNKKAEERQSANNIGFATSIYSPQVNNAKGRGGEEEEKKNGDSEDDVYGVSPSSFRLQKPNNVESATTVKLIRVGSQKTKPKAEDQQPLPSPISSPPPPLPTQQVKLPTRVPVPVAVPVAEPPKATTPPAERLERQLLRDSAIARRDSERDREQEVPGWRPPTSTNNSNRGTIASQNRLRFRDSSDVESAEPTPMGNAGGAWRSSSIRGGGNRTSTRAAAAGPLRNTNTASLRSSPDSYAGASPPSQTRVPKNAGASFATFPKVRNGPPRGSAAESLLNRGRPGLAGLGGGPRGPGTRAAEIRRDSPDMSRGGGQGTSNWPFEGR